MKTLLGILAVLGLPAAGWCAELTVGTALTNGLREPYNVAIDSANNYYISDSGNNRIVRVDANSQAMETLVGIPGDLPGSNDGMPFEAHLRNPQGVLDVFIGDEEGLLVTDTGNSLLRFVRLSDGKIRTLAGQPQGGPANDAAGLNATFRFPSGIDMDANTNIYIADWGNNAIRVMNLNDPAFGVTNLVIEGTTFFRPSAVTCAGASQLWVADTGNELIKLITLDSPTHGKLTTILGGYRLTGTTDSMFGASARFNGPGALKWVDGVGLLISDTLNNAVRLATNYTVFGATNYAVVTFAGIPGPGEGALLDGAARAARFNSPYGLAQDTFNNGFLVVDLKNNAIRRLQLGSPQPPVPTPRVGWVDFQLDSFGSLVAVLRTSEPFVFNNDVTIAIDGANGTDTHYTQGTTPSNPLHDTIENPDITHGSTPPEYRDGMYPSEVPPSIVSPLPDLTIKAIGVQKGRQSSKIASARFQFQTAAPAILGDNAASFSVDDVTVGAEMYYTTNGVDPVQGPPSIGPITGKTGLSLLINTNITFKIRAFRRNYADSGVAAKIFSPSNFVANTIGFGFPSGEASSDFVGAPGQLFYAPVTMNVLSGAKMYSLQFSLTATNAGPNPGPAIAANTLSFQSSIVKPIPGTQPPVYTTVPPYMYSGFAIDPPPTNKVIMWEGLPFVDLTFTDASRNLLGVGWLERMGWGGLYDTLKQDLVKYSMAHDTLFLEDKGRVVLGGFAFRIPISATNGQTYQIRISSPSATSDGVGAPGSDVYINAPTGEDSASRGTNALKTVTAGQLKYLAGDAAPFRWFNAGDFGQGILNNGDVMQVFQSAVYSWNMPLAGSDLFDSMDSCGATYAHNGNGYLESDQLVTDPDAQNALFDGDDTTINQIAFGDGKLDVCDVYVTFRRSLDPSLTLFRRFWTNGIRAAEIVGNAPASAHVVKKSVLASSAVTFGCADAVAAPGQTLRIPITAEISGSYPLRVLMLNLSVNPLDGSPALTAPVQFAPDSALGEPTLVSSAGGNSCAVTWLNSKVAGLTGTARLGTLIVQLPGDATATAAYAIHFDHASASPNGIASFPRQTRTGLITLSDRSGSSLNDNIPDSWRLRAFGTIDNLLSQADADADGDGANNRREYAAGTDPLDPASCLRLSLLSSSSQPGAERVLRWPTVAGKRYIIEESNDLFAPNWAPITTNSGSGAVMELHTNGGPGPARFYRVRLAP